MFKSHSRHSVVVVVTLEVYTGIIHTEELSCPTNHSLCLSVTGVLANVVNNKSSSNIPQIATLLLLVAQCFHHLCESADKSECDLCDKPQDLSRLQNGLKQFLSNDDCYVLKFFIFLLDVYIFYSGCLRSSKKY